MKEGRKLKNLDPINAVGVYIMPERNGASNQFTATIDITETEKYIKKVMQAQNNYKELYFTKK